ncbi:hypothetical protein J0S82_012736, partial [Galemys pyrenaicus]
TSNIIIRDIGKIVITRTQGTKIASNELKSLVFEVSLADLQILLKTHNSHTWRILCLLPTDLPNTEENRNHKLRGADKRLERVKVLKKPSFELGELCGEGSSSGKALGYDTGTQVEQ